MVEVLKYIHDHIRTPLSMAAVARQLGYSKWYFCTRFRAFTGRTFVEYIRHCRIQLAALDILQGKKITDVAMDYGYDTLSGFSKSFLRVYGCVPSEYKTHARECQLYYERRKISMLPLSDRCAILRDDVVNHKRYQHHYCAQRRVYTTLGMAQAYTEGKDNPEIVAAGVACTLEKMTPFIAPLELVVGFNYGDGEYGEGFIPRDEAVMASNSISAGDAAQYWEIIADNAPLLNLCPSFAMTREEWDYQDEWASIGRLIGDTHTVIGYEKVLTLGFEGLLEQVSYWEEKNGTSPLYRAMKHLCVSACTIGDKYAAQARRLLESGDPDYHAEDLQRIIHACSRVPRKPAASFLEAVQSSFGPGITAVELLRYNPLAESKYQISGRTYEGFSPEPQADSRMQDLCSLLGSFLPARIPVFTR